MKIAHLISSNGLFGAEHLLMTMGEKARRRVEEEFNINKIVKEYEKVYFDLAREKGVL